MPMGFSLSVENTLVLDKLVKVSKTEFVTFETTNSDLVVQLLAPDTSQYTLIRLSPTFFIHIDKDTPLLSMPFQKLHIPGMQQLTINEFGPNILLIYQFKNIKYKRLIANIDKINFDFDFNLIETIKLDIKCIFSALKHIKDKKITVEIGKSFNIKSENLQVAPKDFKNDSIRKSFGIETERFKKILSISDVFNDFSVGYGEEDHVLNIIFRNPEIFLSIFFTTEEIE